MKWIAQRGEVLVRPTRHADAEEIRGRIRKSDVEEIWASTHMTVENAIRYSVLGSPICQTVLYKSTPVGMFGASPIPEINGAGVWFMATDELEEMSISFLKMSKDSIRRMLDVYPLLFNWVDVRNVSSVEWLRWCGAEMANPEPFGPEGLPFILFKFSRRNLCAPQ